MAAADKLIITEAEALRELDVDNVKSQPNLLELIESSTAEIEKFLDRILVKPTLITEYHNPRCWDPELQLKQRPIDTVTSVHEDSTESYGATTLLIEGTHFKVHKDSGILVRKSGSSSVSWLNGRRGDEPIRVVYTAGYATQGDIPPDIKKVCREYVAMMHREIEEKGQNQQSVTDDFGTVRRFGPPMLTSKMERRLMEHRNFPGGNTWTRSEAA